MTIVPSLGSVCLHESNYKVDKVKERDVTFSISEQTIMFVSLKKSIFNTSLNAVVVPTCQLYFLNFFINMFFIS